MLGKFTFFLGENRENLGIFSDIVGVRHLRKIFGWAPPRLKSWIRPWYRIRLTICIQWGSWGGGQEEPGPPLGNVIFFGRKLQESWTI